MKSPSSGHILSEKESFEKLQGIGEEHLVQNWETLNKDQKESLRRQITQLDVLFFHRQQEELSHVEDFSFEFAPFPNYFSAGNQADFQLGEKLLKEGKCACVVLAGGQGSRLRSKGPKGCVPITVVKQKTLFQLLAEKIKAASKKVGYPLQVAIMTSPLNHKETEFYFVQNAFFGLDPTQITFFHQQVWPILDFEGHLFLESPDRIARGPNGNGGVFRRLAKSGLLQKWHDLGVEYVNVIPVDNPLALPFDPEFAGFQHRLQSDCVLKVTRPHDRNENVGLLVNIDEKPHILEYSEMSQSNREAIVDPLANLGLYSFSLPFIAQIADALLPLHKAKKRVKRLTEATLSEKPNGWKFEEFIFDVLPLAKQCYALLCKRESTFAPLKNLEGEDSIQTVQKALQASDREIFGRLTGVKPPKEAHFELSALFYYPTDALKEKWRKKPLPDQDYIEE